MAQGVTSSRRAAERPVERALDDERLQQLLVGLTAVRDGDFGTRLPEVGDELMDQISTVFNGMVDQLARFTSEVTRVAREVGTEGKLGGQAAVPGVSGTWKDLTDSVNAMAGNLTGQVRDIAQVATAVAKGDLSKKITVDARGEILELKTTINTMVDQLSSFADEVTRVAREVGTEGNLGGQATVRGVSVTWKALTESVNVMAGNLTGQVRSIAQVATAVATGDLSKKITVDARGEILELKTTINTMVDQLSSFADEVTRVAREVGTEGNLGGQANVRGVSGTWKDLTDNVNVMANNLTSQVRNIAQVTTAVAQGDLSKKIAVEARGEVAALASTINTMVDTLRAFADEVTRVAREVGTEGILGGQARVPHVAGTWKDLTDNVNSMANNLTGQVRNIAQVTTAVARGDLSKKIDVDARGEILELKTTINTMVDQLSSFAAEVTRVAREVGREGRLGGQAQVEGVSGTWKRLTENVNDLAGNLTRQVRAIADVTSAVARGDLTGSISVEAQGEVAELKDNINAMVHSLRDTTQAYQEQDWLKTHVARMSELMQGHRDLSTVTKLILDELTPLVDAQYATFLVTELARGKPRLTLIASYGHPAPEMLAGEFRFGESLIGQAAASKRPIVVDGAPPGYVQISSSLGASTPVNVTVLPILFEDQVLGVIELASLRPFTGAHRSLLEQLTETIGVNVNTILANSRNDTLLAESQRLTAELQARSEELQAQQEELRYSNAELEDKAALLARQNRDIEIKNMEIEHARQELEDRAQQLALASKYKSEFLANMSHELRTPLNSLLILARLLTQNSTGNLTPKQVEFANVIHSAGSDLLQLINDILDLSKVEAGKMDIHTERFRVAELLDYVHSTFQPLTAEKGLRFEIVVAPDMPAELFTDQQRLRQVLRNLLSNAVKFTEAGRVELQIGLAPGVRLAAARDSDRTVSFAVMDTGIGIATEKLNSIFGAFQQADGTTSRKYGGSGLGLSISREVAALLGGEVHVASELGRGSTFTMYLPLRHTPVPGAISPQPVPITDLAAIDSTNGFGIDSLVNGAGEDGDHNGQTAAIGPVARRVLVVEGPPSGLLTLLTRGGAAELADIHGAIDIITANSTTDAVAALTAHRYHCVVLDLSLPGGAAFTLLDELAADPDLAALPVLAHPTGKLDKAHERLLAARSRSQPLELLPSLDELRERITLHLSADQLDDVLPLIRSAHRDGDGQVDPSPAPPAVAHDRLSGRKVLVVEDDDRNVFAIVSSLEPHGLIVLHATDGRRGIETLKRHDDIDIILMDVMMPEMDGYTATAAIREMPRFADLPIIAVTAKAMPGDREKSLISGATDYLTKPVDPEELLACMERWLTP
ncbi:MAG TPA: HAMP domain-containing protein [Pseudonocardiaceae bacterium]|nr:HAMP domain-containing protein [Pseudonocardiaceae bacterium]